MRSFTPPRRYRMTLRVTGGVDPRASVARLGPLKGRVKLTQPGAAPTGGGTVGGLCRKVIEANAPIQEPAAAKAT